MIFKLSQFKSPILLWLPLQGFASKLARRHYNHTLQSRAWSAWRSVIESKWKQRVEKACQVSSCMTLSNYFQTKQFKLNLTLNRSVYFTPCRISAVPQ